jgi:predicted nucleotidyltransferase
MIQAEKAYLTPRQSQAFALIRRNLLEEFPVEKIILYGSVARGEADEESDIDLLILTREALPRSERHRITRLVFEINLQYDTNFSTLVIPLSAWESGVFSVLPIHRQIQKEGIAL